MATATRRRLNSGKRVKRRKPDPVDRVFKALANPDRRQLLDLLREGPRTSGELIAALPWLDRCTVMLHLRVLEQVELILVQRSGRDRWNYLNHVPIQRIYRRWIKVYAEPAVGILDRLKSQLEGR